MLFLVIIVSFDLWLFANIFVREQSANNMRTVRDQSANSVCELLANRSRTEVHVISSGTVPTLTPLDIDL